MSNAEWQKWFVNGKPTYHTEKQKFILLNCVEKPIRNVDGQYYVNGMRNIKLVVLDTSDLSEESIDLYFCFTQILNNTLRIAGVTKLSEPTAAKEETATYEEYQIKVRAKTAINGLMQYYSQFIDDADVVASKAKKAWKYGTLDENVWKQQRENKKK